MSPPDDSRTTEDFPPVGALANAPLGDAPFSDTQQPRPVEPNMRARDEIEVSLLFVCMLGVLAFGSASATFVFVTLLTH